MDPNTGSSAPDALARPTSSTRPLPTPPEVSCSTNEKEALALVESALQEQRPFALVIIDGRMFHGKDYRQIIQHMWRIQRDLQVVLHAVSQMNGFEQIPSEFGSTHQLLVFKFRLVPFEITQLIRTLAARRQVQPNASRRTLSVEAQLLETTSRLEDVRNRLRLEQDHRKQLEDQLCKSKRLENVGRFADSMAHFFSNYLTVIHGHLGVARTAQVENTALSPRLDELLLATKHATDITSQFVTFNRREYLHPQPTHLDQVINSQAAMLQKVLGESITIQFKHKPGLPAVMADPAGLEQTLLSLLLHARDSMSNRGRLMIETRQLHIPDAATAHQVHTEARAGNFAVIVMADTGKGLTTAEMANLFDASKLSQDGDNGGDLSLVLAQGMVRLQGGWISVTSALEVGTEFSIYLPVADGTVQVPATPDHKLLASTSDDQSSTILIVDDEDSVRQVMEYVLTSQGHQVLVAGNAKEAWELWRKYSSIIKLVITDIMMPGGSSGFDLEKAIKDTDPTVPVVFTCGYCSNKLSNTKELVAGENFLAKPFGMVQLLNIVSSAMLSSARL